MTQFVPKMFPGIGGWDYEKVWEKKQEFCKFVLKVENPTGFMKDFREFCCMKLKDVSSLDIRNAAVGGCASISSSSGNSSS